MGVHWQELLVILVIVLVLFGPKRLPEIGSSLGSGIRSFRTSLNGLEQPAPATQIAVPVETPAAAPAAAPVPVEVVDTTAAPQH